MKQLTLILLFTPLFAVAQWELVDPAPAAHPLNDVFWLEENSCWVVGDRGKVLRSDDAGETWQQVFAGTGNDLYSVFFSDPANGWIVGDSGTIRCTTDGGISWEAQSSGYTSRFTSVFFTSNTTGFITGFNEILLKTIDSGENWDLKTLPGGNHNLMDIHFIDGNHGFVGGYHNLAYYTEDGGETWSWASLGCDFHFKSVFFTDYGTGWGTILIREASNNVFGGIVKSTDSGKTWIITDSLFMGWGKGLSSIFFTDENTGYACGYDTVMKTVNGGTDWNALDVDVSHAESVGFYGEYGIISGGISGAGLFKTGDGGSTWSNKHQSLFGNEMINSIHFTGQQTGWIAGSMGIYKTDNQCVSWICQMKDSSFYDLDFATETKGWAVGYDNNVASHFLLKTENSGESWNTKLSSGTMYYFEVDFTDEMTGWVRSHDQVNDKSSILKSANSGETWQTVLALSDYNERFSDLHAIGNDRVWVAGFNILENTGYLFSTTDGGVNWDTDTIPDNLLLNIFFTDPLHGWCIAKDCVLFRTVDGGQSWSESTFPGSMIFGGILHFADPQNGWIICDDGLILRSEDGGETWLSEYSGSNSNLYDITFDENKYGWIVGNGAILRRAEPVITSEPEIPAVLHGHGQIHCYPNPFYNHINISYEGVAHDEKINLKIYDASGNLVEEHAGFDPNGSYLFSWRTGNIAPGLYFCVIRTAYSIHTTKIVKTD